MKKIITLLFVCSSLISSAKTIWVNAVSTYYTWNNGWKNSTKTIYENDSNGNHTQYISYRWDKDWVNSSKYVFEYDNNGNQTQYIAYTWDKDWKELQKATFEYNGNGYQTQSIYYTWDNGWKNSSKDDYDIDGSYISYICDKKWVRSSMYDFGYNSYVAYTWDNKYHEWVAFQKATFEYDDNGYQTQSIYYTWDNGWKNSTKTIYENDSNGNHTQYISYRWGEDWMNSSKYVFEYDNNGNQTQYIAYTWNKGWKELQKAIFEYKSIVIEDNENNSANLGTAIEDNMEVLFSVFVCDNIIVVENVEPANAEIDVFDINGRMVAKAITNSNHVEIPMKADGVYIVKVGNVAKRVMVND
ncbi:MAG: T9SS type A sorting domain-containing protein [Salinivirgaceae bacterium]|nr:T9SS type A sorting domain-containing protein [Salinivirgaceae bacterium]